ncbi:MAG: GTPase ObgE [Anaerolineaceae bacterium]|nr:GTPase ObgE [Anaerolineaceae bacterium]
MLVDQAKIYVRSGDGGDGMVAFRREKYIPRGGPAGGDGGRGGDVILHVNPKLSTLQSFKKKVHFKAEPGVRGGSSNKTGANGDHLYIEVPPGTLVRDADTNQLLVDLVEPDETFVIAEGGRGGHGNTHFKSSSNKAPRVAEKGAPGKEMWITLELKLIADVGIVGVPNAGKSTLLSVISNAKPKIAAYPFTTLEPNLGVVTYDDQELVFADIPGLIEGAHMGVGLGHSFLRHVQRTRMLLHVLDGSAEDPLADYSQIRSELALYDDELGSRPEIVAFNKMDLPQAQERWSQIQAKLEDQGVEAIPISAATQQDVKHLIQQVFEEMAQLPVRSSKVAEALEVYQLEDNETIFDIERGPEGEYLVTGERIERAAAMTHWDYEEAIQRFQKILETLGVTEALKQAGVESGDTVFIGDYELEWTD